MDAASVHSAETRRRSDPQRAHCLLVPCIPTNSPRPCRLTVAGPDAAWLPRQRLHGDTCSGFRDGGRTRTLQQRHRSAALQNRTNAPPWTSVSSFCQPLLAQATVQSNCGPRIRRIGPRTSGSCTVLPCWVTRTTPVRATASATSRTCGISSRHTTASSLNARATSEGQIDCSGRRCASKCRISAAICASSGGCTPAPRAHSGRSRRRPNQSFASFQPCVTLSPAAAASSAKRASVYL